MQVRTADVVLMGAYVVTILAIGYGNRRRVRNFDDFFVAGRRFGFARSIGTLASIFIGGSAIGLTGQGFRFGLAGGWYVWGYAGGFALLALTLLPAVRRLRQYTIADILGARFGEGARRLSSVVIFASWIFFLAAMMEAGGTVVAALLHIPLSLAVACAGAIFLSYAALGGMSSVTLVSSVQSAALFVCICVLFVLGMGRMSAHGGFTALAASPAAIAPVGLWPYIFATVLIMGPTTVVGPDIYLSVWSMKDEGTARRTIWTVAGLLLLCGVMLSLLGGVARVLLPSLPPESSLPALSGLLLSPGFSGVAMIIFMAATMSAAVPEVVVCSSILTRDIYHSWLRPRANTGELLLASRVNTLLVGVMGGALALAIPGVVTLSLWAYRIFVPAIVLQVIAALAWNRASTVTVLTSMVAGPGVTVVTAILFPSSLMTYVDPVVPGIVVTFAVLLVGGFVNRSGEKPVALRGRPHLPSLMEKIDKA